MSDFVSSSNTPVDASDPYVGRTFRTLEEAEECFRAYSLRVGFGIRIKTTRTSNITKKICSRLYECHRGRQPLQNETRVGNDDSEEEIGFARRRRDSFARTNCMVKMFVSHKPKQDHWLISSLELAHNHPLVTPSKVSQMHQHKKMGKVARSLIHTMSNARIGPSDIVNVLAEQAGGIQNLNINTTDVSNAVQTQRRAAYDLNDAQSTMSLLKRMQMEDPQFTYEYNLDDEHRITTIFWVDGRSRLAYQHFGDVVTFDTTYRTNKYSMPFAPFTGVNHHYHSILFGFALLRDESESSFVWLFKTWLEAMNNKAPTVIITDQDLAMKKAIATVFPNTRHSLCTWHISNKYPERLHPLYAKYPDFKHDFDRCVNKSLTIVEFEERWVKLVEDYSLQDHDWLQHLYELKEQWVGVYTRRYFSAGMKTTGRSESMNSTFDRYVGTSTTLKGFVTNPQKAVAHVFVRERSADFASTYKQRRMLLETPLELSGAKVYTREIFLQYQVELRKSGRYSINKVAERSTREYKVYSLMNDLVPEKVRRLYTVSHETETDTVTCVCQKFEFHGMLCRHILRFFTQKNIKAIPDKYVLPRWTKGANRLHGTVAFPEHPYTDFEESETLRYNHLVTMFTRLSVKGVATMAGYRHLREIAEQQEPIVDQFEVASVSNTVDTEPTQGSEDDEPVEEEDNDIRPLDPIISQTKGRKRATRMKSSIEQATQPKKLRKCALCNKMTNHDKRNHYKALGISLVGLQDEEEDDAEEDAVDL